jgi:uncharacterized phiE125 gp8 family phage protein
MAAGDLTTVANVKDYLDLAVTTKDALLGRLVSAASAWIKSWTNRDFTSGSYSQVLDGNDAAGIMLDQYPVTAVSSLTIDGVAVPSTSYTVDGALLRLTDGTVFRKDVGNVLITYTAGFVTIPADVEQACIELVAWRFTERSRIQQVSKSMGGEVVAFSMAEAPKSTLVILSQYKRVVP